MLCLRRLAAVIVTIVAGGCQPAPPDSVLTGHTMGTTYTVRITGCAPADCGARQHAAIEAMLEAQEQRFSHYREDSEISRFNRHGDSAWFPVSAELAELAELAAAISELSRGAFDISVAPAVNAWGFGPPAALSGNSALPDAATIAGAGQAIGYRNLQIRLSPPALRKLLPQLQLDMSAIAKGHAVDQLAYLLEDSGHRNYLVEIGGELRTAGVRADGTPWRVGLEAPDGGLPVQFIITPGSNAVATSGDYRNFFVRDGTRYSHTLDPLSARPVNHGLAAVSVIAPSAAQADALATALLVLGPERGLVLATEQHIAALFTLRSGTELQTRATPELAAYLLDTD